MSTKKTKTEKLYIQKSHPKYGYHVGNVYDIPVDQAEVLKNAGCARSPKETLPKDFPFRKELIEAGLETVADVESAKDLTKVKGIGDASEKEIAEYLAK